MTSKRETEISWRDKSVRGVAACLLRVCSVAPLHHAVMSIVYLGYAALLGCGAIRVLKSNVTYVDSLGWESLSVGY
jgi:hypothetical protein